MWILLFEVENLYLHVWPLSASVIALVKDVIANHITAFVVNCHSIGALNNEIVTDYMLHSA